MKTEYIIDTKKAATMTFTLIILYKKKQQPKRSPTENITYILKRNTEILIN